MLTEEQKKLVEKLGVMNERSGYQPASARVLALLLVSDDPELTFDQIREVLNLSKSATSNAINNLLNSDKIEYITKSGDRKRYFRSRVAMWKEEMKKGLRDITKAAETFEEVLRQRPGNTTEFNQNLKDVIDFMKFMGEELPEMFKRWEAQRE